MDIMLTDMMERAKIEIGETESRKMQSLKQFREWIDKHPFIKNFEADDIFLLSFLRASKFSMDRVFETFEKFTLFIKSHENWFDFTGDRLNRVIELLDTGFIRVMKTRDAEGERIIVVNHSVDPEKFNGDDIFRAHCLVIALLQFEDETQLLGMKYICDLSAGVTMKHVGMMSLKSFYEFSVAVRFVPIRYKSLSVVGVPTFAGQFVNMIKLGLSSKMKNRFHVLNDINDLWHCVDKSAMTENYGGDLSCLECLKDFRKIMNEKLDRLVKFYNFDVDMEKAHAMRNMHENIGSFRMLDID